MLLTRYYYPYYGAGPWGPGLQMIPALATVWDIPGSAWRGDVLESAWQGEVCVTTAAGRSCFSAAPSTIHFTGRTFRLSIPYPGKVVTFVGSRVMSFQYLAPN